MSVMPLVSKLATPQSSIVCNMHAHLRHVHAHYRNWCVTRAVRDCYSGHSCYWDSLLENALRVTRVTRVGMPSSYTRVTVHDTHAYDVDLCA